MNYECSQSLKEIVTMTKQMLVIYSTWVNHMEEVARATNVQGALSYEVSLQLADFMAT